MAKSRTSRNNLGLTCRQDIDAGMDLFMQSPENIRQFNNWQSKNSALEVSRSRAFGKTPFDVSQDTITSYDQIEIGGDYAIASVPDYDVVQILGYIGLQEGIRVRTTKKKNDTYIEPSETEALATSAILFEVNSRAGENQLAYDSCNSGLNARKLNFLIHSNNWPNDNLALFPGRDVVTDSDGDPVIDEAFKNEFNFFGYRFTGPNDWARRLDKDAMTPTYTKYTQYVCGGEYTGIPDILGGSTGWMGRPQIFVPVPNQDYDPPPSEEKKSPGYAAAVPPNANSTANMPIYMSVPFNSNYTNYTQFYESEGELGSFEYIVKEVEKEFTHSLDDEGNSVTTEEEVEVEYTYKVILERWVIKDGFSAYGIDLAVHEGAGRVDIFTRTSGKITSVQTSGSDIDKVTLSLDGDLSDGTTFSLNTGDYIKVTSALDGVGKDNISNLNGLFYYKDNRLYRDKDFRDVVRFSQLDSRYDPDDIKDITWTLLDSAETSDYNITDLISVEDPITSRWTWQRSYAGLNEPGNILTYNSVFNQLNDASWLLRTDMTNSFLAPFGDIYSWSQFYQLSKFAFSTYGDELVLRASNFNLGADIDINENGDIAFSQPASNYRAPSSILKINESPSDNFMLEPLRQHLDIFDRLSPKRNNLVTSVVIGRDEEGKPITKRTAWLKGRSEQYGSTLSIDIAPYYFDDNGMLKKLEPMGSDVCKDVSEGDTTTDFDDPTGATYGEGDIFDSPTSEPVVSTDGDNVDFYDYGEAADFDEPDYFDDSSFSAGGGELNCMVNFRNVFTFPETAVTCPINFGCVFLLKSGDPDIKIIDASSGNSLIASPLAASTGGCSFITQLHWRKSFAQNSGSFYSMPEYRDFNDDTKVGGIFRGLGFSNQFNGTYYGNEVSSGTFSQFDMLIQQGQGGAENPWRHHAEHQKLIRPYLTVSFSPFERYTDGFGTSIALSKDGTLFVEDRVTHETPSASFFTDALFFDYNHVRPKKGPLAYEDNNPDKFLELGPEETLTHRLTGNKALDDYIKKNVSYTEFLSKVGNSSIHIKLDTGSDILEPQEFTYRSSRKIKTVEDPVFNSQTLLIQSPSTGRRSMHVDNGNLYVEEGNQIKIFKLSDTNPKDVFGLRRNFVSSKSPRLHNLVYDGNRSTASSYAWHGPLWIPDIVESSQCQIWPPSQYSNLKSYGNWWHGINSEGLAIGGMNTPLGFILDKALEKQLIDPEYGGGSSSSSDTDYGAGTMSISDSAPYAPSDYGYSDSYDPFDPSGGGASTVPEKSYPAAFYKGRFKISPFTMSYLSGLSIPNLNVAQEFGHFNFLIITSVDSSFQDLQDFFYVPVDMDMFIVDRHTKPYVDEFSSHTHYLTHNSWFRGGIGFGLQNTKFEDPRYAFLNFSESYLTPGQYGSVKSFRVSENILVHLESNTTDDLGNEILDYRGDPIEGDASAKLIVYDTSTDIPEKIQSISANLPSLNKSIVNYSNSMRMFNFDDSLTPGVLFDFISFDVVKGKIFASFSTRHDNRGTSYLPSVTQERDMPYFFGSSRYTRNGMGFCIFTDSYANPLMRAEHTPEFTEMALPFFGFSETFDPDATPFDLNSMYEYNKNEGSLVDAAIFDVNNSHKIPCNFYSVKSFGRRGRTMTVPESFTIKVEVSSNVTSGHPRNRPTVLPVIQVLGGDPRLEINQMYGSTNASFDDRLRNGKLAYGDKYTNENVGPLYVQGLANKTKADRRNTVIPSYQLLGDKYVGTATVPISALFDYTPLSSDDNRTIKFNDGNGVVFSSDLDGYGQRKPNSYTVEFDDANKESYIASRKISNTTLGIAIVNDDGSYFRTAMAGDWDRERAVPYTYLEENESSPHAYINYAKVFVEINYKEIDIAKVRRFTCGGNYHFFGNVEGYNDTDYNLSTFPTPAELAPDETAFREGTQERKEQDIRRSRGLARTWQYDTLPTIRANRSGAQSYLNLDSEVLLGTSNQSIQVVAPQLGFDTPYPDFMALHMISIPSKSNDLNLRTVGHIEASGQTTLKTEGVVHVFRGTSLFVGGGVADEDMNLSMPEVFGFECTSIGLSMLPPRGTRITEFQRLAFAGGEGINKPLSLGINTNYMSGGMDFNILGSVGSGVMNVSMSGVHGFNNSMPCVDGNLFVGAMAGTGNSTMPLQMGRFDKDVTMNLTMEDGGASKAMTFALNTKPINTNMDMFQEGKAVSTSGWPLFIGRQFDEKTIGLNTTGPIPLGSAVDGDTGGITAIDIQISGGIIPTANSIDNNYSGKCDLGRIEQRFDLSLDSEQVIEKTKTNSISKNVYLPNSNKRYGYYAPTDVKTYLRSFSPDNSIRFYDAVTPRSATASNERYLVVASNTSSIALAPKSVQIFEFKDENSLELKYTYDNLAEDLIRLGITKPDEATVSARYKSVDISENGRIAISIRFRTTTGLRDGVFILQPAQITTVREGGVIEYDLCAIDSPVSVGAPTFETVDGWFITHGLAGGYIDEEDNEKRADNYLGTNVQWSEEDLFYDKQTFNFADICKVSLSDNYASSEVQMSFRTTVDGVGYQANRYAIPAGTKVGFGSAFKIHGDYAAVSAPLLDAYVSRKKFSVTHAPSPDGAVFVYKNNGSTWDLIETLYSQGYNSSNISDVDKCSYDPRLFGYSLDLNSDSGFLAISEPIKSKVYKYSVHGNDTVSSIDAFTNTSAVGFGKSLNICSNSILTNGNSSIIDPVYDASFSYTDEENVSEVEQYVRFGAKIKSVSSQFTFIKDARPFGSEKILVGRIFKVIAAGQEPIQIEKISILDVKYESTSPPLFISGPVEVEGTRSLSLRPKQTASGSMKLQFASIGVTNTTPLHVHVPDPASGDMPFHLRVGEELTRTLFIDSQYIPVSGDISIDISGPESGISDAPLYVGANEPEELKFPTSIYGHVTPTAFGNSFLTIKQDDPIGASGAFSISQFGIAADAGSYTSGTSLFLPAGNFGPSSGTSFLYTKVQEFGDASGTAFLALKTDPASGIGENIINVAISGQGTNASRIDKATSTLMVSSTAPVASGVDLVLYRKGIGGGQELDANNNLIVYNLTEASDVNLAVSGANIATGDMNIAISGVIGLGTGIIPTFVRGYQD